MNLDYSYRQLFTEQTKQDYETVWKLVIDTEELIELMRKRLLGGYQNKGELLRPIFNAQEEVQVQNVSLINSF